MSKAVSNMSIPLALRHKVSQSLLAFTGAGGLSFRILFIGVSAFGLCAAADHNGFWFLVGACISVGIVAILYTLIPLRPYRGDFYARDMKEVDAKDPVVLRLVQLLASSEASRMATVIETFGLIVRYRLG